MTALTGAHRTRQEAGAPQQPAAAAAAQDALDRAVAALLRDQSPAGWWKGELRSNVTMDAEDLMLRHVLGIGDPAVTRPATRWIRSQQRADGSWSTFPGGPGDVSATVEAYVSLRLAGAPVGDPATASAAAFVRAHGGLGAVRVFTRIWLAMLGLWPWDEIPAVPPELVWLPRWFPLNVYDWACWARQTVVPITVVSALRLARPVAFDVDELWPEPPDGPSVSDGARPVARPGPAAAAPRRRGPSQRALGWADALVRRYHRHPVRPVRRAALRRAASWVVERQEADGSWGGIQPPWVYSILALHALGYPLDHPVLRQALAGIETFAVRDTVDGQRVRRLEACQSPVWDTALAVVALRDAGRPAEDPAVAAACDWLLAEEVRRTGDWAVRRPGVPPGGWAFEFANDGYPDVDDTAEVLLALRGVPRAAAAVRRGVAWVLQMQCRDGGWAAFDVDNTSRWPARLPFCDFGAVTDPPSADVTAHVVEMLAAVPSVPGVPAASEQDAAARAAALARGVTWLLDAQEPDGSWFGRWGANHVYGVGAVVPALVAAGLPADHPSVRRAVGWLVGHQNDDGGWGEDLRSYRDPSWRGRGASTPSQTAWALLALLAAGVQDGEDGAGQGADATADGAARALAGGVAWLVATQRPDGWWDEDLYTATGFPGDFYLQYGLYRLVFPTTALARYCRGAGSGEHR